MTNRIFVIDVYTAYVLNQLKNLSHILPYPSYNNSNIRVFFPQNLCRKLKNDLLQIGGLEDSTFIYSMWEGYLKKKSNSKLLEYIKLMNMSFHSIHTSGHAGVATLARVINALLFKQSKNWLLRSQEGNVRLCRIILKNSSFWREDNGI